MYYRYIARKKLRGAKEEIVDVDVATAYAYVGDFIGLLMHLGIKTDTGIILKLNNIPSSTTFNGIITKIKLPDQSLIDN